MKILPSVTWGPVTLHRVLGGLGVFTGMWLGFANDVMHLPPLILFWPLGLACLGRASLSCLSALRMGWLCSMAGGLATLYWLTLPVHNVGGLPWLPALGCAVVITACVTFAGGIFAAAAYQWRNLPAWGQAILLGIAWFLLEECGARILGFPWLSVSGALAAWPVMVQFANVLGGYALAGVWTTAILLCAFGFLGRQRDIMLLAAGGILVIGLLSYGWRQLSALPISINADNPDALEVLFVEGNIDQNQKWVPSFQRQTVDLYLTLTEQALATHPHKKPLILWPETAMPFFFEENRLLTPRIRALVARSDALLLLGAPGREDNLTHTESKIYNRAFLLGKDGTTIGHYDKEHLVPFGEYLPEWLDWQFLEALLQGVGVYSEGQSSAPLRQGNLALGVLICYEGIFPWLAQQRVEDGATILADISNDGWFGNTPAARQHLYLTILRAIEQNRWILRGTNTGISAIVDTRGRLVLQGAQFTTQTLWGRALLENESSLYHRCAPWLPLLATVFLLVLLLCFMVSRRNTQTLHP